jgi:hypothetical protein
MHPCPLLGPVVAGGAAYESGIEYSWPAGLKSIRSRHLVQRIRDCGFIVYDEDLFLQSGVALWGAIDFILNRFVPSSNPVLA